MIGITFVKRLYTTEKRKGLELACVLGACKLLIWGCNRMKENTALVPFILPCVILLSILTYKNIHLLPPSSLLWLSFSPPLLFLLPFPYVLRILHVSESLSELSSPSRYFWGGQSVLQPWKIWVVEEGLRLRGRAELLMSIPCLPPVWPLTLSDCDKKFLDLGPRLS